MLDTNDYINFLASQRYEDIMNYNDHQLESDHNFIQWIFPTTTKSAFTHNAPIIDIKELRTYHVEQIVRSLNKMTDYWGILDGVIDIPRLRLLNGLTCIEEYDSKLKLRNGEYFLPLEGLYFDDWHSNWDHEDRYSDLADIRFCCDWTEENDVKWNKLLSRKIDFKNIKLQM